MTPKQPGAPAQPVVPGQPRIGLRAPTAPVTQPGHAMEMPNFMAMEQPAQFNAVGPHQTPGAPESIKVQAGPAAPGPSEADKLNEQYDRMGIGLKSSPATAAPGVQAPQVHGMWGQYDQAMKSQQAAQAQGLLKPDGSDPYSQAHKGWQQWAWDESNQGRVPQSALRGMGADPMRDAMTKEFYRNQAGLQDHLGAGYAPERAEAHSQMAQAFQGLQAYDLNKAQIRNQDPATQIATQKKMLEDPVTRSAFEVSHGAMPGSVYVQPPGGAAQGEQAQGDREYQQFMQQNPKVNELMSTPGTDPLAILRHVQSLPGFGTPGSPMTRTIQSYLNRHYGNANDWRRDTQIPVDPISGGRPNNIPLATGAAGAWLGMSHALFGSDEGSHGGGYGPNWNQNYGDRVELQDLLKRGGFASPQDYAKRVGVQGPQSQTAKIGVPVAGY